MSFYETPEMNVMLYARNTGRGDGDSGPGDGDNESGSNDDVVDTSGDLGDVGGEFGCTGIGPYSCPGGSGWNGGGCVPGAGSGSNICDGTSTATAGVH